MECTQESRCKQKLASEPVSLAAECFIHVSLLVLLHTSMSSSTRLLDAGCWMCWHVGMLYAAPSRLEVAFPAFPVSFFEKICRYVGTNECGCSSLTVTVACVCVCVCVCVCTYTVGI
jgi:hypothetical protein